MVCTGAQPDSRHFPGEGLKADTSGNMIYRLTARNFNPECAMASKFTVAEVEEIVELGGLDPHFIHTPGIYIQKLVLNASPEKRIEKRTVTTHA